MAVLVVIVAYLVGSIPSGYLLVRVCRGVDVRRYGPHNVGAINVFRVGGARLGVPTLLADIAKALVVVVCVGLLTHSSWLTAAAALAVLLGHAFSIWFLLREHRFSEGKSVASGLGVLLGLVILGELPWPAVATPLCVWVSGLLLPRLVTGRWWCVSPATLAATVSIPLAVNLAHPAAAYRLLSVLMCGLILVRHANNLRRLRTGTEPRLGRA